MEQVEHVELISGDQLHLFEVAHGAAHHLAGGIQHHQHLGAIGDTEAAQGSGDFFGLRGFETRSKALHHGDVSGAAHQRSAQSQTTLLAVHRNGVAAGLRPEHHTTTGTQGSPDRTLTGATGALLLVGPYKQKGTGRARQGSIRTPLRPGGGVVFGPKPRSYTIAMNRKERRLALRTALMSRAADITVVKGFASGLETPKTKEITAALSRFGIADGSKVLVVLDAPSEVVRRSVRNLEKVKLIAADQLNVFDLLHANSLVVSEEALAKIQEVYGDD